MKLCNEVLSADFAFRAALDRATVLLSMSKGGKRIDSVWGAGGGQQSVKHLVKEVMALLPSLHWALGLSLLFGVEGRETCVPY